jgi:hypothetical protein
MIAAVFELAGELITIVGGTAEVGVPRTSTEPAEAAGVAETTTVTVSVAVTRAGGCSLECVVTGDVGCATRST